MKNKRLINIGVNIWFELNDKIYIKSSKWPDHRGNFNVITVLEEKNYQCSFGQDAIINIKWWEAIAGNENIPNWILHKAFLEGAKIEWKYSGSGIVEWRDALTPIWGEGQEYRVKPTKKYTINLKGKEIELSEESYKKLKESLKED